MACNPFGEIVAWGHPIDLGGERLEGVPDPAREGMPLSLADDARFAAL